MRVTIILLSVWLLTGCASTNVIDATWDEATKQALNGRASESSTWTLSDVHRPKVFTVDNDSVGFLTEIRVGQLPPETGDYARKARQQFYWEMHPLTQVSDVTLDRQNLGLGLLLGGLIGAASGARAGHSWADGVCEDTDCTSNVTIIGALAGGLVMGLLGAAVGRKRITVYRFDQGVD